MSTAENLAKLSRVIESCQTIGQLTVAHKYARLMYKQLKQPDDFFFKGFHYNNWLWDDIQADLKKKRLTIGN